VNNSLTSAPYRASINNAPIEEFHYQFLPRDAERGIETVRCPSLRLSALKLMYRGDV